MIKLKSVLYCGFAYAVFGTSPCYAQVSHSITFQNGTSGRHTREISGHETQDEHLMGISLSTSEDQKTTHSSSTNNGLTQEQEYTYVNSAMSQTVEIGHLRREIYVKHFEVYDYSDYATHHSLDFSF
uniref:Uncharacterized protein n=1 Tax=Acaryochloris sp. HICR111A TaxID=576912 RepID=I6U2T2_9CYAN|nr:hypothetical protein [Acaryochloris sp. HICR111A]